MVSSAGFSVTSAMIEAGGLASFALHLLDERDELLERHALGDEGVDDRIGVGVIARGTTRHPLARLVAQWT